MGQSTIAQQQFFIGLLTGSKLYRKSNKRSNRVKQLAETKQIDMYLGIVSSF
ncbi:hypothetical protein RMB13_19095 [Acinetobacter sp. V102_4]|uniref:hypothetical protein n=1 Tax=Acinetobacter sp. V102_4 TaxID=3072984 RepID=UPI00287DA84D|nr:hypothetical protein [Acinetobacter sp. V102_4]MDS7931551.1 hypothetical protein [Acinetobacter sp. V102_4]